MTRLTAMAGLTTARLYPRGLSSFRFLIVDEVISWSLEVGFCGGICQTKREDACGTRTREVFQEENTQMKMSN